MFDREILRLFIIANEGWRPRVYHDSLGIPSVGVGLNLNRLDARARIEQLGLSYQGVLNGEIILTPEQISTLLDTDIDIAIHAASQIFTNFYSISNERQIVLIDLAFNLGQTRLSGFVRMIDYAHSENWTKAARELKNSKWFTQVGKRVWNVEALRSGTLPNFAPHILNLFYI